MSPLPQATLMKRLLAWLYDALIVIALWLVSGLIAVGLSGGSVANSFLTQSVVIIVIGGYFVISWSRLGATAGMRAWRLELVSTNDSRLSASQALIRLAWCIVLGAPLLLGLLTAMFYDDRRPIYDRVSNTRVIQHPKRTQKLY